MDRVALVVCNLIGWVALSALIAFVIHRGASAWWAVGASVVWLLGSMCDTRTNSKSS